MVPMVTYDDERDLCVVSEGRMVTADNPECPQIFMAIGEAVARIVARHGWAGALWLIENFEEIMAE